MKPIVVIEDTATDKRIKKYFDHGNPPGRHRTSLMVEVVNGEIDFCSYEFNGHKCAGVDLEELRRFKRLLNGFKNI